MTESSTPSDRREDDDHENIHEGSAVDDRGAEAPGPDLDPQSQVSQPDPLAPENTKD